MEIAILKFILIAIGVVGLPLFLFVLLTLPGEYHVTGKRYNSIV